MHPDQADFNKELSSVRAAAGRAVASVKTSRMLSEEGGRYRAPIGKYGEILAAVTGLFFFSNYYNPSRISLRGLLLTAVTFFHRMT